MPLWFAIFVMLFTPVVCLVSVVAGAYLMYCREQKANPLRSGLADFIYFSKLDEDGQTEKRRREEEVKGFYS